MYTQSFHMVLFFWGNSHFSTNIFKIQKRIIRIITNVGRRNSCRPLFKQLQILPLPSQYIFSLLIFVNKNRELFLSNSEIHNINTRYNNNLHLPSTNLTLVQKGVLYSGSKIYNHLQLSIKAHSTDAKRFKTILKSYLSMPFIVWMNIINSNDNGSFILSFFILSILLIDLLCLFIFLIQ
jgi:hypothetical protein